MSEITTRMLPSDLNAETAVLSAMMIDSYSVAKGIEIINENHFYKTAHRLIYKAITEYLKKTLKSISSL